MCDDATAEAGWIPTGDDPGGGVASEGADRVEGAQAVKSNVRPIAGAIARGEGVIRAIMHAADDMDATEAPSRRRHGERAGGEPDPCRLPAEGAPEGYARPK